MDEESGISISPGHRKSTEIGKDLVSTETSQGIVQASWDHQETPVIFSQQPSNPGMSGCGFRHPTAIDFGHASLRLHLPSGNLLHNY